jgi:hypothetical protein
MEVLSQDEIDRVLADIFGPGDTKKSFENDDQSSFNYGEEGTKPYDLVPEVMPALRAAFPEISQEKVLELEKFIKDEIDEALNTDRKSVKGNKRPGEMPDDVFLTYASKFLNTFPEVPDKPEQQYQIESFLRDVWHMVMMFKSVRNATKTRPDREWPENLINRPQ